MREPEALGAPVIWPDDGVPSLGSEPFIQGPGDLQQLRLPDPLGRNRMREQIKALRLLREELGPDEVVYGWVEAPFQEAAILRDLNHFMVDLYDRPEFVHQLLRFATEMELAFGLAQIEAGARFIGVGDAVASLVSPRFYQEYNLPYLVELVAGLKGAGARVKYHACGNTAALLPHFGDVGADILNLDALIDLEEAKRLLGPRVCLKGNLDPVKVLLEGTPEEVRAAARRCIQEGAAGGGFILSPGCEVPRGTPPANLVALVATAVEYGTYPLQ
ncbi:MAG: uroporphyrinogen decarboxylase family protein [Anaerolineae bacterium]|nr:uroporphyrinogen decarboxylase family protein [Anaerolineae bacterium]